MRRCLARWAVLVSVGVACAIPSAGHADRHHYTIDEGVRLGSDMEVVLAAIADEFHRRTGREVFVTSGTRSAEEQADAMYDKLRLGQPLTRLYRDYDAANEITQAYRRHRRESRSRCVSAMAQVIQTQVRRGCYISRHLHAAAADVRSRDMSRRERRIFTEVVRSVPTVSLLEEGTPPHFHLQLAQ